MGNTIKDIPNYMFAFDMDGVVIEEIYPAIGLLFCTDKFTEGLKKRNRLSKELMRNPGNAGIKKSFEIADGRLASMLWQAVLWRLRDMHCVKSENYESLVAQNALTQEQKEKYLVVAKKIDAMTFVNDIMLGLLNDVIGSVSDIDSSWSIPELQGVQAALETMSVWGRKRRANETEEERELFNDYADSIENYLKMRSQAYVKKYCELKKKKKHQ